MSSVNGVYESRAQFQGEKVNPFFPWVVLVCGVDIVDSTGHKMGNPSGWYEVFSNFLIEFDRVLRIRDKNDGDDFQDGWNLWRVVGDELIYYRAFRVERINGDYSHLSGISGDIYRYVNEFSESVKNAAANTDLDLHGYAFLLDEDRMYLNRGRGQGEKDSGHGLERNERDDSVLGDFRFNFIPRKYQYSIDNAYNSPLEDDPYELLDKYPDSLRYTFSGNLSDIKDKFFIDFIGRGVDQGFRLAEYSSVNRFILSPKLVYCLCCVVDDKDEMLNNIYFSGSNQLKGCGNEEMGISRFPLCFLMIKTGDKEISYREQEYYKSLLDEEPERRVEKIKNIVGNFIREERLAYEELLSRISPDNEKKFNSEGRNRKKSTSSMNMLNAPEV